MKRSLSRILLVFMLAVVMLGMWATASGSVLAAPICTPGPGTSCIDSVNPSIITNPSVPIQLTISGDGFSPTASVVIDGGNTYPASFVDGAGETLKVNLPA